MLLVEAKQEPAADKSAGADIAPEDEESEELVGARIPIPTETFLEQLSHWGEEACARELQAQIEDVEEFRTHRGNRARRAELKYHIRCRWKGEEATGGPGPYTPDIDDCVKVNIRPYREAGLLAVKEALSRSGERASILVSGR